MLYATQTSLHIWTVQRVMPDLTRVCDPVLVLFIKDMPENGPGDM